MDVLRIGLYVLLILSCLFLIAVVLLQPGKSAGLSGSIAGGAEQMFGKGKARSLEGKLLKLTKISAVMFFLLSLGVVILEKYGNF